MNIKKISLLVASVMLAPAVSGYDVIINGTTVYSGGTVVTGVTVEQSASQLILTTNPTVSIQTGSVTPDPVAPVFTSGAVKSIPENQTNVGTLTASDGNGDAVAFSIVGGVDQGLFTLSGSTLSFSSAPDYEDPQDVGSDNVYDVQVQASDGALVSTLNMSVSITDVDEGGSVDSCTVPAGVEVNYPLDLAGGTTNTQISIPLKQNTLSMKFTVPGGFKIGQMIYSSGAGTAGVNRIMWITECPTKDYVNELNNNSCSVNNNTNGTIKYASTDIYNAYGYCGLEPGKEYYLNIKNIGCSGTCPINREIK